MKKICFITMGNIYTVPYLKIYTQHIEQPYSFIYWDREDLNETDNLNTYYRFDNTIEPYNNFDKIVGYIKYRKFIEKILLKEKFDLVIFLQTWSALLVADIVEKHYPNRYIVDVRDYTYEKNPFIYRREQKLIEKSKMCIISSEGYKEFLPPNEYKIFHNTRDLPLERVKIIRERKKEKSVLNISFVGYVNYQEQHKKILRSLKNDSRFHLNFIGTRSMELESFCKENSINNVTLIDTFDSDKTLDFYENTDFVNNLYGNHTPTLDYALSNKLYFAAELYIPILTCSDTYMSKVAGEYGFGFDVDVSDVKIGDKLWSYYNSIDWDKLSEGCSKFMNKVHTEQKDSYEMLKNILFKEQ